jgi:hypothetical protein
VADLQGNTFQEKARKAGVANIFAEFCCLLRRTRAKFSRQPKRLAAARNSEWSIGALFVLSSSRLEAMGNRTARPFLASARLLFSFWNLWLR